MMDALLQAIVTFLIVMDPLPSLSVFLLLTKGFSHKEKLKAAREAVIVAGVLAFVFIFLGEPLLNLLGISINSFKIAGGLVLFLLGLEMILNLPISRQHAINCSVAVVVIATPLITGPGVITTSILTVYNAGLLITSIAAFVSLFVTWIILREAEAIQKLLGQHTLDIISKLMGLLIASLGINFIITVFGF
jgi:multiple antibiotic resistance protein